LSGIIGELALLLVRFNNNVRVIAPAIPSTVKLYASWNALTAAAVFAP